MKHGNIAVFVPLVGCPHRCSFCDQRRITGQQTVPTADDVRSAVDKALSSDKKYDWEIAFFGGSFTAIDRDYMISLLQAAYVYVERGDVSGIRISTRPDAIDDDVLPILKKYGVTAIELGAQSMCDEVLTANGRGHNAQAVRDSSRLIKEYGFSLGLQMMTGLYKSSRERDIYTANEIIALAPDTVRIYPTVTLKGTALEALYNNGSYTPMTLDESVDLCALLLEMFGRNNIEVIRLGLHYSESLMRDIVYDNYHPAFRELCESRLMLREFIRVCGEMGIDCGGYMTVRVHPSCVSKFVGQKRGNIALIRERFAIDVKTLADKNVPPLKVIPQIVCGCVSAENAAQN